MSVFYMCDWCAYECGATGTCMKVGDWDTFSKFIIAAIIVITENILKKNIKKFFFHTPLSCISLILTHGVIGMSHGTHSNHIDES